MPKTLTSGPSQAKAQPDIRNIFRSRQAQQLLFISCHISSPGPPPKSVWILFQAKAQPVTLKLKSRPNPLTALMLFQLDSSLISEHYFASAKKGPRLGPMLVQTNLDREFTELTQLMITLFLYLDTSSRRSYSHADYHMPQVNKTDVFKLFHQLFRQRVISINLLNIKLNKHNHLTLSQLLGQLYRSSFTKKFWHFLNYSVPSPSNFIEQIVNLDTTKSWCRNVHNCYSQENQIHSPSTLLHYLQEHI